MDAAAIPEVFLTAWDALVLQGGLTSGRWALVHAGASGVGTAAIQIAKAIGARIAVTCSAGKAAACRRSAPTSCSSARRTTGSPTPRGAVPGGFDVVLDVIGGDEIDRNLQAVAPTGTIVQVGLMGGASTHGQRRAAAAKRATWVGTTLRGRPIEEKVGVVRRFAAEMLPLFDTGALRPVIDSRYPLDEIADAHGQWKPTPTPARSSSRSPAGRLTPRRAYGDVSDVTVRCGSRWRRPGRGGRPPRSGCRRSCRSRAPAACACPAWRPSRPTTAATRRR